MADNKNTNTESKTTTTAKAVTIPKATAQKAVATPQKAENVPMNLPENADMSTDVFSKEMLAELTKRSNAIMKCQNKIDSSFETIAFNLYWIHSKQAFKADGFDSIQSYCENYFGYSKTTCYSLISVVERFAKRDENGALIEKLDERMKGYSVSKLSLMVGLTDDQLASLKPEMSVREIKKFVKSLEGKSLPELSEGSGDGGEDEEEAGNSDCSIVDSTAREIETRVVREFKNYKDMMELFLEEDFTRHLQDLFSIYPNGNLKLVLEY